MMKFLSFKAIKTILFLFVLVILAYAVWMAYSDISKNMKAQAGAHSEGFYNDDKKLSICLYKATWCHYCKEYLNSKVFDNTYDSIKKDDMYKGVVFATYDYDENKSLAEKYNIESFPTIVAVDGDGNLLDTFSGNRNSTADIVKFVDENLKKVS